MPLCEYGCGQEAVYQFKNGKWCCSENVSKCPEIIRIIRRYVTCGNIMIELEPPKQKGGLNSSQP